MNALSKESKGKLPEYVNIELSVHVEATHLMQVQSIEWLLVCWLDQIAAGMHGVSCVGVIRRG